MKKNKNIIIAVLVGQIFFSCGNNSNVKTKTIAKADKKENVFDNVVATILYKSEDLIIRQISKHVYEHISFLETNHSVKLSCNGMIVVDGDDAVIFDTPTNDQTSIELIEYLRDKMNLTISAVVATHFHRDCLGGLQVFHRYGVNSYASNKTIQLAKKNEFYVPQQGFDKQLTLKVGTKKVSLEHLGEGHTSGNIIGYFPDEQVLFGGGLIKEIGAKQGDDLADANLNAWPRTLAEIKTKYPDVKTVIPGHGELGGPELLDYTMNLFAVN